MKMVVQLVSEASVTVDGTLAGQIGKGFLVLLGIEEADTEAIADRMLKKLTGLRIFQDENGKTNLALKDVGGELLIVSQFTLYADCRKGNRPSFVKAAGPEKAEPLYEYVLKKAAEQVPVVQHGIFGAMMDVALVNEGPFTVVLDSHELGY